MSASLVASGSPKGNAGAQTRAAPAAADWVAAPWPAPPSARGWCTAPSESSPLRAGNRPPERRRAPSPCARLRRSSADRSAAPRVAPDEGAHDRAPRCRAESRKPLDAAGGGRGCRAGSDAGFASGCSWAPLAVARPSCAWEPKCRHSAEERPARPVVPSPFDLQTTPAARGSPPASGRRR